MYKRQLLKIDEEYEAKNEDLKDILVEKLLELTEDMVSQGVKDYSCLLYTSSTRK